MLQTKTVEPLTLELLKDLMQREYLTKFTLVGGTALALQMGHRFSVDLDFFTVQDFDSKGLVDNLIQDYSLTVNTQMPQTLIGLLNGIKTDFIRFRHPFIRPLLTVDGIRMLSIEDIAPMKMDAIAGRGSKKDFFDLYFLVNLLGLDTILDLYHEKYAHDSIFHVIRSMAYFDDAEADPTPIVFDKTITWEKVKDGIKTALKRL